MQLYLTRFARLVCLLLVLSFVSIWLALVIKRSAADNPGCLVAEYPATFLLDLETGKMLKNVGADPVAEAGIERLMFSATNNADRVFAGYRRDGSALLMVVNSQNGQRSTLPLQNTDGTYITSADGKYLAAFNFVPAEQKLIVYSLPDLKQISVRPLPPNSDFNKEWSHTGHQLAYLEQDANHQGLLTLFDPDTLHYSSAVLIPDLTDYMKQGKVSMKWSPDGEAVFLENARRLDLYDVKSGTVHHVIDGATIRLDSGTGTPFTIWIGGTHRVVYPVKTKDGMELWVYDPHRDEQTELEKQAAPVAHYSPDFQYVLLDIPNANGQWSSILLNLITEQSILVKDHTEENGIFGLLPPLWIEARKEFVFGYQDETVWMRLDGSNKHTSNISGGLYNNDTTAQNLLAYTTPASTDPNGPVEIGVLNLDTEARRPLGVLPNGAGNVYISPDARVVGFQYDSGTENRGVTLSLFATDGSWSRIVHTDTGNFFTPLWSPDSSKIVMETYIYGQKNTVHLLTAHGDQLKQLDLPPNDLRFTAWTNCDLPDQSLKHNYSGSHDG